MLIAVAKGAYHVRTVCGFDRAKTRNLHAGEHRHVLGFGVENHHCVVVFALDFIEPAPKIILVFEVSSAHESLVRNDWKFLSHSHCVVAVESVNAVLGAKHNFISA